ncbi:membrane protein DedA with SNARE-associated domain [Sphingomonas jinjuensis]|uniref:Membrane protein DedA with SNARE-associated domain n=1 Tax=Sphingomonas jinjuensis TaxID=535907 RepID=A0A840F9J5_9SPHN|nr:DedA family protein [Sphingomonas jinjuensis]MBB4154650.1 membrane protein DedA with SNARE-associated domain [Sphingomonas jinjuensis]
MTDFILDLITRGGYLGIAFLMALENVFPPIPSEVIMGLGGMAVGRGQMSFVWLVVAGTIGTVVGNYPWYWLGRRFGYHGLKPFVDRYGRWLTLEWEDIEKITHFFHHRGWWVVFVFRFMPTFRTLVSLPAGMGRMAHWRFILATAGGSAIWNTILAGAGVVLDRNFEQLDRYVGPIALGLMAAGVGFYLYRVATWKPRAQR